MNRSDGFRLIALYLPQFYPIPENDEWWGKGYTEWTCVGRAKPLFRGHDQPRVPADLGYCDLRVPETRQAQADMARAYGIDGFCYWHYWFGRGKRIMERPFQEVLASGVPDFPFCLGWANHTWMAKLWTLGDRNRVLIAQTYPGEDDSAAHFHVVLPAFKDRRYMTVNGKPIFMVFAPLDSPDVAVFLQVWRRLAVENGLPGIYFIGQGPIEKKKLILNAGFDAINDVSISSIYYRQSPMIRLGMKLRSVLLRMPRVYRYSDAMKYFCSEDSRNLDTIPTICPNWDHSPRSGLKGFILHGSSPKLFKKHVMQVLNCIKDKPPEHRIAIIKSWNEWGEGNYLEPDIRHGRGYLEALKESIDAFMKTAHFNRMER